jgi:hypothetical protein
MLAFDIVTEADLLAAAYAFTPDACPFEDFAIPLDQEDMQVMQIKHPKYSTRLRFKMKEV